MHLLLPTPLSYCRHSSHVHTHCWRAQQHLLCPWLPHEAPWHHHCHATALLGCSGQWKGCTREAGLGHGRQASAGSCVQKRPGMPLCTRPPAAGPAHGTAGAAAGMASTSSAAATPEQEQQPAPEPATGLLDLPVELLCLIWKQLDKADRKSLCCSARSLRACEGGCQLPPACWRNVHC